MNFERTTNTEREVSRESRSTTSRDGLTQEALTLFECWPGGPIVSNINDCYEWDFDAFPNPVIDFSTDSRGLERFANAGPRELDGNPPLNPNDDWTDPQQDS